MMIIMSMLALQLFCHLPRISLRHFESTAPGPNVHAAEEVDLGSDLKDWDRLNDVSLNDCVLSLTACVAACSRSAGALKGWHRLCDVCRAPCLARCLHII